PFPYTTRYRSDALGRFRLRRKRGEREAARATGRSIGGDVHIDDLARFRENLGQLLGRGRIAQVPYKDLGRNGEAPSCTVDSTRADVKCGRYHETTRRQVAAPLNSSANDQSCTPCIAPAHLRHHLPPRRRQDHAHGETAAIWRCYPARGRGQGAR